MHISKNLYLLRCTSMSDLFQRRLAYCNIYWYQVSSVRLVYQSTNSAEVTLLLPRYVCFPHFQDMNDIIVNLSSGSWADRKDGLIALQNVFRGNRLLK